MNISIGICLYNEERNISAMLSSLLSQKTRKVNISEIILVISGSTDKTYKIAKSFKKKEKRMIIFRQKKRRGKASAVNFFIEKARNDIVVLLGGDVVLEEKTVEYLTRQFKNKHVGMTGAHPVPINNKQDGFLYFAGYMLWDLHHRLSLRHPKMGEVIAFRKIFKQIPVSSSVDEANIEPLIKGQGYTIVYVPEAVVYNKTPTTFTDFIKQRKRIFAGHLAVKNEQGYQVATMRIFLILSLFSSFLADQKKVTYFTFSFFVILLEAYARLLGFIDYRFSRKNHQVWEQISSTKQLFDD